MIGGWCKTGFRTDGNSGYKGEALVVLASSYSSIGSNSEKIINSDRF